MLALLLRSAVSRVCNGHGSPEVGRKELYVGGDETNPRATPKAGMFPDPTTNLRGFCKFYSQRWGAGPFKPPYGRDRCWQSHLGLGVAGLEQREIALHKHYEESSRRPSGRPSAIDIDAS